MCAYAQVSPVLSLLSLVNWLAYFARTTAELKKVNFYLIKYFKFTAPTLHPVIEFDWLRRLKKRIIQWPVADYSEVCASLPFECRNWTRHARGPQLSAHQNASQRELVSTTDLGKMSEQTSQPEAEAPAGAKLVNQYKPVGIAALNAAALCKNAGASTKKTK